MKVTSHPPALETRTVTKRRTPFIFLTTALLVVFLGSTAYGVGSIVGDGNLERPTTVVVKNTGGVFNAQGTINHFVETGLRYGAVTIDIKDKTVLEADYFGSYFCFIDEGADTITKSFSGTVSVANKEKGEVLIKLPRKHVGCNLVLTASVLRPGQGVVQEEIVLKKMVLTADATKKAPVVEDDDDEKGDDG